MTKLKLTPPVVIEFPDFKTVEPSDLIIFSEQYEVHRSEIISTLKAIQDKSGFNLMTVRVGQDGQLKWKERTGTVRSVTDDGFTFISQIGGEGVKDHDEGEKADIGFYNVLGEVPMLPSMHLASPFKFGGQLTGYLAFQKKVKNLLSVKVGEINSTKIYLRYGKDYPRRKTGKIIECEILKVNRSNMEIKFFKSDTGENVTRCIEISPGRKKIVRFITSKFYISRVECSPGIKNTINAFDEGEEF